MVDAYTVLTRRSDFLAANRGLRVARPGFVLLANPNDGFGHRAGITVTKKIGNAVVRNRMKRRFRALLRELLPEHGLPDTDHVLIGRENGIERDFAALRTELVAALGRAREGKSDSFRPRGGPRKGGSRKVGPRETGSRETGPYETGPREAGSRNVGSKADVRRRGSSGGTATVETPKAESPKQ